ncbi:MAG: hypothetical protein LBS98_01450 [Coriobacteriales bacterium]|jgi:hypothetical protein|nr:hypothetical protein [Coriobacteriales bacterium]
METVDLTEVQWDHNLTSYTSGGAYLKATIEVDGEKRYLKLSNYDDERGFIGLESIYEYLASKLGQLLGLDVLDSGILKARISHNGREHLVFIQQTHDFLLPGTSKTPFERLYVADRLEGETRLAFLRRSGFSERTDEMLLFDYLIYNRDRHCNNLEFLKGTSGSGGLFLAPLFDNGVSFFAPFADRRDEIESFDLLSNKITNSDFGTRYLEDNLGLIEAPERALALLAHNSLTEATLAKTLFSAFDDDEAFPGWHRAKALELIIKRMHRAQTILNNR